MNPEHKKNIRLFLGSFVDINKFYAHDGMQEKLKKHFDCPVKFVEKQNIHLTWKFIGEADSVLIPDFTNIIESAASKFFNISINFDKFEIWPNTKFPRQLVITGRDLNGNATDLHEILNTGFQKFGVKEEKRKFNPHITIARFKLKQKPEHPVLLPPWLAFNEAKIDFTDISLIKSFLTPKGSIYEEIKKFTL